MEKYYLSGPMSNVPQFNFPLFTEATANLRSAGWNIVSPHEEDAPEVQAAAWASPDGKVAPGGKIGGKTWGDMLAGDVKLIADDVAGIIFLPDWVRSRGAQLEAFTGLLCSREFYLYDPESLRFAYRIPVPYVKERLR